MIEYKENTVCMRENSFYVDTIWNFRDRRYKYKELAKMYGWWDFEFWKNGNFEKATEAGIL